MAVPFTVGIDYTSAARQSAGIGRLTRCVVHALASIDHTNRYRLLIQGREAPVVRPDAAAAAVSGNRVSGIASPNFSEVSTRISERWWTRIWYRLRLPVRVDWVAGSVDVFHSPDFLLPPVGRRTRTVVTIHDLSFLHLPECFEPVLAEFLRTHVPRSVERADWILADSENTRQDLIELLHAPEDRVSVLYPGVEPRFCRVDEPQTLEAVRKKYALPKRFVLCVGTVQPRKNYARLVEAFAQAAIPDLWLVVFGSKGWLYEDILAQAGKLGIGDKVLFPGFVDDADLPAAYSLAECLAFPSLYEGFGIPPLEAMACGTPVLSADNSSLPEAVGDAGLLLDALDTAAWADALRRITEDGELRETLIRRGFERASQFTWTRSGQTLLEVYRVLAE